MVAEAGWAWLSLPKGFQVGQAAATVIANGQPLAPLQVWVSKRKLRILLLLQFQGHMDNIIYQF